MRTVSFKNYFTTPEAQQEKCDSFHYTKEQLETIAECLGEPSWDERADNWRNIFGDGTNAEIAKDKHAVLQHQIGHSAVEALYRLNQIDRRKALDQELNAVDKITRHATKLMKLLDARGPSNSKNWHSYILESDASIGIRRVHGKINYQDRMEPELFQELRFLVDSADAAKQKVKERHKPVEQYAKNPPLTHLVRQLVVFWEMWTNTKAGGSKEGGPAARFVMHCVNPVEVFAEKQFNKKLRVSKHGLLDDQGAGNLIYQILSKEKEEGERSEPIE